MRGVYNYLVRLVVATCAGVIVGCAIVVWDFNLSSTRSTEREVVYAEPLLPVEAGHIPEGTPQTHIFNSIKEAQDNCPEQRYAVLSSVSEVTPQTPEQYACVY